MRYNKERLDAAYAKVGLLADSAWQSDDSDPYIRANQELWNRECALKGRSENIGIPRSVLDTIPNSRLAEYGTYWYDEMREGAYEPTSNYTTAIAQPEADKTVITYVNQEFRNEDLFQSQEVEKLFNMLSDTKSNTDDIENRCRNFLKGFEMKEVGPDRFTLIRKPESGTKLSISSESTESESEVAYETIKVRKEKVLHPRSRDPPRGTANNFDELILQMQLHSEEIRRLWETKSEQELNVDVPEFYPSLKECTNPVLNYEMVPNVQPWLNYGYPLRHSDFAELAALSSDMDTLRIATPHLTPLRPVQQQLPPPPPPTPTAPLVVAKEPPRRLYSAVLQNQMTPTITAGAAVVAATTVSTDELDELEREAIEQYRPSNESLAKTSEDSIISAKFQELERQALEQYNSASATETSAGAAGGADNAGNVATSLHEPPCGGKPNPYAALLLANWNSVLVGLYRSRLLSCLGSGARFR